MKSIKWKLVILYLGLVLIVMIVSGTYILLSLQNIEMDKAKTQLKIYAEKISEQVVLSYDEVRFQTGLADIFTNSALQIQGNILNSDGITLASTEVPNKPYPLFKDTVIVSAMAGITSFNSNKKSIDSNGNVKETINYAMPVMVNVDLKYIVYTQMDGSDINESLNETRKIITVSVGLSFLLTAAMGYVFAKTLTEPILMLTVKAREMAGGKLDQKIKVRSADEIGQLTSSFNNMASELNKTLGDISREKNKLEIILHNMTDGVLSFDREGNLMHCNTASFEMLEIDNMRYSLSGFVKAYDINSNVYLDMEPGVTEQVTIPIEKKFISATFSPYSNVKNEFEGTVVVLQDITEQKKLDDMRKEFVANVSHELRTPLTTVKSYTETLMDGAIDDKEIAMEFLGIIDSEADRMAFLVRDLLQLSRFDNKQVLFNVTEIELNEFMNENIRQSKIHADNKNQILTFEHYKNTAFIYADRDRINQVINNIVTNAIKYSPEGAEIKAYIEEDKDYYKVCVKDGGMGISKEDIPRIFERFYRVDKARSRAMGGTGLGLAIAKEIIEGHGGKITVESKYGKGTTMIMWFPKSQQ